MHVATSNTFQPLKKFSCSLMLFHVELAFVMATFTIVKILMQTECTGESHTGESHTSEGHTTEDHISEDHIFSSTEFHIHIYF